MHGFGVLCFEYSSFQKDSALVYAIHMNNLAQKSNDKELLIEAKLDYSRILSSMGFFKEALAIVNSTQQEQLSPRLKAEYFLAQFIIIRKLLPQMRMMHKRTI